MTVHFVLAVELADFPGVVFEVAGCPVLAAGFGGCPVLPCEVVCYPAPPAVVPFHSACHSGFEVLHLIPGYFLVKFAFLVDAHLS